jgi:hypothetical protein
MKWFATATNTMTSTTLETSLQQMLREMEALFRKKMWNHIVLGVSFWSFYRDVIEETFNF